MSLAGLKSLPCTSSRLRLAVGLAASVLIAMA
jgi:hypothetical protein